ncbi:MAG: ORF6N domain-containing protein [Patescibacteria group bacterium]|nr:ORF6N domain-containing protein [Patescibacteria group bacterium]
MFRISKDEYDFLISQIAISKNGSGGRRHLPRVFTEHGAVMLSSILRSDKAVEMSKFIVRAFIKIREILSSNKDLAYKVQELEREQKVQNKHINALYAILGKLMDEPVKDKKPIGFQH